MEPVQKIPQIGELIPSWNGDVEEVQEGDLLNTKTQMKLFNAIAAGAVIGASLISVKPAAATSYCYETTNNASVCILSVRSHKRYGANQKLVKYSINGSVDQSVSG